MYRMCLRKIHCHLVLWVEPTYDLWHLQNSPKWPLGGICSNPLFGCLLRRFAFKKQLRKAACKKRTGKFPKGSWTAKIFEGCSLKSQFSKHRPACGTWSLFYPWYTSSLAISRSQRLATVPSAHQHPCASCMIKEPTITFRKSNMMKDRDVMMIKPSVENDRSEGSSSTLISCSHERHKDLGRFPFHPLLNTPEN